MQRIKALHPPAAVGPGGLTSPGYTLDMLDDELSTMAMLHALPCEDYASFISSVLLLNGLTKEAVLKAFQTEEIQCRAAEEEAETAAAAAAAHTITCYICDANTKSKKQGGRCRAKADAAKATDTAKVEEGCDGPAIKAEAAVCQSTTSPPCPSDVLWNTDSGALTHMTPHREWFLPDSFKSWRVPIYLANNAVVYSAGKGNVLFRPAGKNRDGNALKDVIITSILFVPKLVNNLLSITALSVHQGFTVTFCGRKVFFNIQDKPIFSATIDKTLTSYLDGHTLISSPSHAAKVVSTGPTSSSVIERNLLHRRMCHLGARRLEQLITENLTEDLKVKMGSSLPDVCEPCLQGKQHRAPFPHLADHVTEVLGRVFSDVHGPMPVGGHQTNDKWWCTFINDARNINARYWDAMHRQQNKELPLIQEPPPPLPPSPYPEELVEQPLWHINVGDANAHNKREVAFNLNVESDEALMLAGCAYVEHGADFATPEDFKAMRNVPYIQATGALLYLAMCTRPDIAFAVGVLCKFNACPGPKHWRAVKHLMRYIRSTLDYKIEYSAKAAAMPPSPYAAFTDADHGGNLDNGRSTTGSILLIAGGAISWISKQQTLVALSSTEAKFVAASETGRELCWLCNFLSDIGSPQSMPMTLNMDNQSAISVSKQPEHMGHLKHLDWHWFWLQQAAYNGKLKPVYIPTADMVADLLTKSLPHVTTDRLRCGMGLVREFSRADLSDVVGTPSGGSVETSARTTSQLRC
ncbi:hypothetical protein E4T56_gene11919 [Termitomyces sp. T112]|nr:hypothetical protein E4T56_gene11919 [Termitomyces sp. T112]